MSGVSATIERVELAAAWIAARLTRVWPLLLGAVVLAMSWGPLRQIRVGDFRTSLRSLDTAWVVLAVIATVANIAVMGLYDVIAFRHTRARWTERWRHGAVAFAWSNFLTLGPLAGPAVRFLLYQRAVDNPSELHGGVLAITLAFSSGLAGWTLAALGAGATHTGIGGMVAMSVLLVPATTWSARTVAIRWKRFAERTENLPNAFELAAVGWLDWLLAGIAFAACMRATGAAAGFSFASLNTFILGQGVGLISFVPGGLGSADAFWIAHLPLSSSAAAAALTAYRAIYYIGPWVIASLLLLSWLSRRTSRRLELARRIVASLVGAGGFLLLLSSASPAMQARLPLLQRLVPLGLVELSVMASSFAGILLVVLARALARGYQAAFRATMMLLTLSGIAAMIKGLDWEEATILLLIGLAARSQASLFNRPSRSRWLERSDIALAFVALGAFIVFGTFSFHLSAETLSRWTAFGYRLQATRFVRTALSMAFALAAAAAYVMMREPRRFTRMAEEAIDKTLEQFKLFGVSTNAMIVSTGDKDVFEVPDLGFCLYRTMGPYLLVFSDPVVRNSADRAMFLDRFFAFAAEIDRRPAFYQVSPDWMPALHDRGYGFFKVGEEAHVDLASLTLKGSAGKLNRQILNRAERAGLTYRVMELPDVSARMTDLADVSAQWLSARDGMERQFSVGFFDEAYLKRHRCAVVEDRDGKLMAFANLLEGPRSVELSVDLMRYRSVGNGIMEFMILSVLLEGQRAGYARFNLGMAPLAEVGAQRDAHRRERLAYLLFRRGEQWYNFQGLRFFKQKFTPEWHPRYLAYQNTWEWPIAAAYLGALTAGGWRGLLGSKSQTRKTDGQGSNVETAMDVAAQEA